MMICTCALVNTQWAVPARSVINICFQTYMHDACRWECFPWFLCTVCTHWIPWHKLLPPPDTGTCMLLAYRRCNAHVLYCHVMYIHVHENCNCEKMFRDRQDVFWNEGGVQWWYIHDTMRSWRDGIWCDWVEHWKHLISQHGFLPHQDVVHLPKGVL